MRTCRMWNEALRITNRWQRSANSSRIRSTQKQAKADRMGARRHARCFDRHTSVTTTRKYGRGFSGFDRTPLEDVRCMKNYWYAAGTSTTCTPTSTFAKTGHPKTDLSRRWKANSPIYGYEWSITMRKRQKEYHAAHGNGTPTQATLVPDPDVPRPLPTALQIRFGKTSHEGDIHIFTDGSLKNGCGGWAIVAERQIPKGGMVPKNQSGDPINSSTVPELHAIEEAVDFLQGLTEKIDWAVIKSDSASSVNLVEGAHQTTHSDSIIRGYVSRIRQKLVQTRNKMRLTFQWV